MFLLIFILFLYLIFSGESSFFQRDRGTKIFLGVVISVLTISFAASMLMPMMGFNSYRGTFGMLGSFLRRCF